MTASPTWTPAPRPGIVPLQPMSFGRVLGRSFSAMRHNPKVMLGFALVVQSLGTIVATAVIFAVGFATFGRLATLYPGSEEFETVLAGSIALTGLSGLVISLATGALTTIVQGIVVGEVAHAVVAEKQTLAMLWRRVRPAVWRLLGYAALVALATLTVMGVVGVLIALLWLAAAPVAFGLVGFVVLAAIPLSVWLTVKLLLVPSVLVLEQASITAAIVRSWRLTDGRFWSTFGVIAIISVSFGALIQAISLALSLLITAVSTVFAPTGDPTASAWVTLLVGTVVSQSLIVLIQTVALIVQSTAGALIYIDARMRREGLDLDLAWYVEHRDAGHILPDPYLQHIGRTLHRPATFAGGPPPAARWTPTPGTAMPGYTGSAPSPFRPAASYGAPPVPGVPAASPSAPAATPPDVTPPGASPSATQWTAPGADRA